jgi:molybdopterin molybdotransferase
MMGNDWKPITCELPMQVSYRRRSSDRLGFVPVLITDQHEVLPVEYHGSAHISSLSFAQGIIAIPPGRNIIEKGEIVSVRQI